MLNKTISLKKDDALYPIDIVQEQLGNMSMKDGEVRVVTIDDNGSHEASLVVNATTVKSESGKQFKTLISPARLKKDILNEPFYMMDYPTNCTYITDAYFTRGSGYPTSDADNPSMTANFPINRQNTSAGIGITKYYYYPLTLPSNSTPYYIDITDVPKKRNWDVNATSYPIVWELDNGSSYSADYGINALYLWNSMRPSPVLPADMFPNLQNRSYLGLTYGQGSNDNRSRVTGIYIQDRFNMQLVNSDSLNLEHALNKVEQANSDNISWLQSDVAMLKAKLEYLANK